MTLVFYAQVSAGRSTARAPAVCSSRCVEGESVPGLGFGSRFDF